MRCEFVLHRSAATRRCPYPARSTGAGYPLVTPLVYTRHLPRTASRPDAAVRRLPTAPVGQARHNNGGRWCDDVPGNQATSSLWFGVDGSKALQGRAQLGHTTWP